MQPIIRNNTRIFRPSEIEMLLEGARKQEYQTNVRACLFLGARYVELREIQKHREWFDGNFIQLPRGTEKKVKRQREERTIHLNPLGKQIMGYFFDGKPLPSRKNWGEDLKRWAIRGGLDPMGICPKATRKTWETWLIHTYPMRIFEICLSQGHTQTTSLNHYMGIGFLPAEKEEMRKYVEGWG